MKRHIIFILGLLLPFLAQAQTDGFNPNNPPDPNWPDDPASYYTLTCEAIPDGTGQFTGQANTKQKAGENVYVAARDHDGCYFVCWKDAEGNTLTDNDVYSFTMPAKNVTLYAIYTYNPDSPADPEKIGKYVLTLKTEPQVAGTFNFSGGKVSEGTTTDLYAFPNPGFKLLRWENEAGDVLGTATRLNFLMPSHATTLTAVYEYAPEDPIDPGTNLWDALSGEAIIDYFSPGRLDYTIRSLVGDGSKIVRLTVDGEMNSSDWAFANTCTNLVYLDLSRVAGTNSIPSYTFSDNTNLQEIELPEGISTIGNYAFQNCTALTIIDSYATVPPAVSSATFEGVPGDLTVFVPESSVDLYKAADGWKDFTILPMLSKICMLGVTLETDVNCKGMGLELINVKSGLKYKYVITDQTYYTFPNLVRNTKYKALIKTHSGKTLAETDVIDIDNELVEVTINDVKHFYNIEARLLDQDGNNRIGEATITWTDQKEQVLSNEPVLDEQLEGEKVFATVALPASLASVYSQPETVEHVVSASTTVDIQLEQLPTYDMTIKASHLSDNHSVFAGFTVTIDQLLAEGIHEVKTAVTTKHEDGGEAYAAFSGMKLVPTTITISADGYKTLTDEVADMSVENLHLYYGMEPLDNPIAGTINMTYQPTVAEGETPVEQSYYEDYANVSVAVYDFKTLKPIKDLSYNYPHMQIEDADILAGDSLLLIFHSNADDFDDFGMGVGVTADRTFTANAHIVQHGGLRARFLITDNTAVKALLFDDKGTLVQQSLYANFNPKALDGTDANDLTLSNLPSGNYTLITMGESTFFSSIFDLNRFGELGLQEGVDYLKNEVTIKKGVQKSIRNVVVPLFDESKFYYTGANTQFSANKSNVIQGNYLTLNARIDFADNVKAGVSEVELLFPLPIDNNYVNGSLMIGKTTAEAYQYQYEDNRTMTDLTDANGFDTKAYSGSHMLTVQLGDRYTDQVKFCVVPTLRGNYTPTAYVRFKLDGKTVVQPIGSVAYTVNDVTIWAQPIVSLPYVHVDGNAPAFSEIYIRENGYNVAYTTALADGYWSAEVMLDNGNPQNLSMREIQAFIVTPEGNQLTTERRFVEYNEGNIQGKDVEMTFYNNWAERTIVVDFDLEHVKTNQPSYPFQDDVDFVFKANLTNNSPEVVDTCVIRVFTNNHEWIELPAKYIPVMDRWAAHSKFDIQHMPIGVRVWVGANDSEEINGHYLSDVYEFHYGNRWNARQDNSDVAAAAPAKDDDRPELFTIDLMPVGDKQLGINGVYFQDALTYIDRSFFTADTISIPTLDRDTIRVYEAADGSFYVHNPKTPDMVWGVRMGAGSQARSQAPAKATIPTDLNDALKQRINTLADLMTFIASETTQSTLEAKWAKYRHDVLQYEQYPPTTDEELQKQAVAQTMAKVFELALMNKDKMLEVQKKVNLLLSYARYGVEDVNDWQAFIDRILPCNGLDDPQARSLSWISQTNMQRHGIQYLWSVGLASIASQVLMTTISESGGSIWREVADMESFETLYDYMQSQVNAVVDYSTSAFLQNKAASRNNMRVAKRNKNSYINCGYDFTEAIADKWDFSLPYPIVDPIIDPSGYVYEGVSSNRLEGVTATAYYKRVYEDMYGDLQQEIVKWDAENYGQQNPLLTDEQGMYQWDVPQGTWQVKFEKEGYQTAYSEWLPVPPPQLDVNIAMVQLAQPEVVKARAFEAGATTDAGIELTFSKFMKPAMLTADNIFIKGVKDGQETMLEGLQFSYPDQEVAIEGSTDLYAKKVFITTDQINQFDEIYVIVNRVVESYAGIAMASTYSQRIYIEKLITALNVEETLNLGYTESATLRIAAVPTEGAAGRKVKVTTASTQVVTLGDDAAETIELTLDADGQAEFTVNGVLYGTTALKMAVVDEDVTALTMVNVVDATLLEAVKAPEASRISGTAVYRGQTVTLSCATEGATIYYTTDGTCPCESATRKVYQSPIAINEPMTLKIMSVGFNGTESEVREYNYLIRQTNLSLSLAEGWNWTSHDLANAMPIAELQAIATEVLTQSNTAELSAEAAAKLKAASPVVKQLTGDQYNPASRDIQLAEGWNWLGYPVDQMLTLDDALAQLPADEGDFITNLTGGFAEYADGEWQGLLQTMSPGQGYLYKSTTAKSFVYNTVPTTNARALGHRPSLAAAPWTVNARTYPSMMCITAELYNADVKQDDNRYYVGAFVDDECRGVGQYADGLLYIVVYGNEGDGQLTFKAVEAETEKQEEVLLNESVSFSADVLGSVKAPYPIYIGQLNAINDIKRTDSDDIRYYNMSGQRVDKTAARGIYIRTTAGRSTKVVRK